MTDSPMLHLAAPGVVLTRPTDSAHDPHDIRAMARVLDALEGFFTPLVMQVDLDILDDLGLPTGAPLDPSGAILSAPAPEGVRFELAGDLPESRVHRIDEQALATWLGGLLGPELTWTHLRTVAAKVYVKGDAPAKLRNLEGQPFVPPQGRDAHGAFVAGPAVGSSIDPPIVLDTIHEGYRLELHLRVVWPLWSAPGSAGQQVLAERLRALLDSGWSLDHASGAFAALAEHR